MSLRRAMVLALVGALGVACAQSSAGEGDGTTSAAASACASDCSSLAPSPCFRAFCDEARGSCTIEPRAAGAACDDGLFCTVDDACDGLGACKGRPNACGSTPVMACEGAVCDEPTRSCRTHVVADGTSCAPQSACSISGECQKGHCVERAKDCFFAVSSSDVCKVGKCNPTSGACELSAAPDGTSCGAPSVCATFACQSGACTTVPVVKTCNDGNACTTNDTCTAGGFCVGTPQGAYNAFLSEPFLNNARGWTADPGSWVFADGLAGEDVCGSRALGRTTTDHTGSPDNHGRVTFSSSGATTARSCLTSPELDTSSATTLRLELWHTLDLQASGVFVVQVGDGTTWTTFDFSARQECSWTSDSFDITPSKGPKMKVRFCAGASTTPFAIRLDDVVVATAPCP